MVPRGHGPPLCRTPTRRNGAHCGARIVFAVSVATRLPNPVVQNLEAGHACAQAARAVVVRDEIGTALARHRGKSPIVSGPMNRAMPRAFWKERDFAGLTDFYS
jgi:hypothetical protein